MKTIFFFFSCCAVSFLSFAQTKTEIYQAYANLLGGKWETKGNWANGTAYHQQIEVEYELNKAIFTVKTQDFIDAKQFDKAQRNYGIRAWAEKENKMKFWEFDVFGGITEGTMTVEGSNLYHIYPYPDKNGGVKYLCDAWIFQDKDTYLFKVCEYENGKMGKEYMSSTYKRLLK